MADTQKAVIRKVDAASILTAWNLEQWGRQRLSGNTSGKIGERFWTDDLLEILVQLRVSGMRYDDIDNMLGLPRHAAAQAVCRFKLQDKLDRRRSKK